MKKILEIPKLVFVILFLSLFSLIEKQVVEAASFDFSPSEYTFYHQCPSRVNIEIDVTGDVSNAADIEIYFDPSEITIIDSNPNQSGKQIGTGDAYEIYFGNEVDEINGVIRLAGASFSNYVTNTKTFAYIDFESKIGFSDTTEFEINFTGVGDTKDSNIAETLTSDDLLDDVTNGAYDFTAPPFGSCTADVIPPNIIFVSPTPGQTGVPSWTTVRIQITDTLSGVNLDTVQFTINGEIYTPTSSQVVYSGSSLDYIFTINPSTEIFENDYNTVLVTATDYAGTTYPNTSAPTSTHNSNPIGL